MNATYKHFLYIQPLQIKMSHMHNTVSVFLPVLERYPQCLSCLLQRVQSVLFKFSFCFSSFFYFLNIFSHSYRHVCYRRSEVPGGGPGLEGISGGGDPMPISGSWVNRKPCKSHKCNYRNILKSYLDSAVTVQNVPVQQVREEQTREGKRN